MNYNIQEIIIRILQDSVSEEEMHFFSEWIHKSDENKKLFFDLKDIYDCRKGELYPDNIELETGWNRLWEKLQKSQGQGTVVSKKQSLLSNRWRIAIAAVFTGLLILSATLFYYKKENNTDIWVEVLTAPRSHPRTINLSDGSTIQLNASSFLKYPEKFNKQVREVYLDGEALFKVTKQEGKAFIVYSGKQRINVLGTQFNVMDYSSDAYSITTLISGKVRLETFDAKNNMKSCVEMTPCQQLSFDKDNGQVMLSNVNTENVTSWTTGVYSFEDMPLEQIVQRLENIYDVTILIPDKISRKEKYTGKFSSKQEINEIIDVINFNEQFNCISHNDTITLQRK